MRLRRGRARNASRLPLSSRQTAVTASTCHDAVTSCWKCLGLHSTAAVSSTNHISSSGTSRPLTGAHSTSTAGMASTTTIACRTSSTVALRTRPVSASRTSVGVPDGMKWTAEPSSRTSSASVAPASRTSRGQVASARSTSSRDRRATPAARSTRAPASPSASSEALGPKRMPTVSRSSSAWSMTRPRSDAVVQLTCGRMPPPLVARTVTCITRRGRRGVKRHPENPARRTRSPPPHPAAKRSRIRRMTTRRHSRSVHVHDEEGPCADARH